MKTEKEKIKEDVKDIKEVLKMLFFHIFLPLGLIGGIFFISKFLATIILT